MSAIARYFLHEGCKVGGYDRTPSPLTAELEAEGAAIHYDDNTELIELDFFLGWVCIIKTKVEFSAVFLC